MLRSLKNLRYRLFYGALLRRRYPLMELGERSTGCNWFFCPTGLNKESVVYSGGVGRDITFEHALVHHFGCSVVLFDPSPTGGQTMRLPQNQIPQFKFHRVALAGRVGQLNLAPPVNVDEGSWFMQERSGGEGNEQVPCVDLSTLLGENRHDHIDLLKLDIEGAEYEVLDDLLRQRLLVKQVLVEFHHQMLPNIRRSQTIRTILRMVAAGYRLLKQDGNNHTFLHRDAKPPASLDQI